MQDKAELPVQFAMTLKTTESIMTCCNRWLATDGSPLSEVLYGGLLVSKLCLFLLQAASESLSLPLLCLQPLPYCRSHC